MIKQATIENLIQQARKLHKEGNLLEAALLYKQLASVEPYNIDVLYEWASIASERGNLANAQRLLRKVLSVEPHHKGALTNLGEVHLALQRPARALKCFEAALNYDARFLPAYDALARLLAFSMNDPWKAEEVARKGLAIDNSYGVLRQSLAKALLMQGRAEEAIEIYEEEMQRQPELKAGHLHNLAVIYNDLGQSDRAEQYLAQAIAIEPDSATANLMYARVHKYKDGDPHFEMLRRLVEKKCEEPRDRARAHFALSKAYDDIKSYEEAFLHLEIGNRIVRSTYEFDIATRETYADRIQRAFADIPAGIEVRPRKSDPVPIFIVGMPRSGTTVVDQILFSHPQVASAGEIIYLDELQARYGISNFDAYRESIGNIPRKALRAMRNEYLGKLERHAPEADYITDKMPTNFFFIGIIRILFPQAKVIHCRRNAMDTCFSIYRHMFEETLAYAYDLRELARYYRCYERLMRFWHEQLPGFIHDVQYEELVSNQERVTRTMLEFCGLPWDNACLEFYKSERLVPTSSALQVKKPIYSSAIGAWRRYERYLHTLRDELSGLASEN